jgi:hypothetical protein
LQILAQGDEGHVVITDANDQPVLFVVGADKDVGQMVVDAVNGLSRPEKRR